MKYDADIFDAVEFGDLRTVKLYLTKDININFQDLNGTNLIMLATYYNHKEIVKHLLSLNPDLYLTNNKQETVFQIAKKLEDKELLNILIKHNKKENKSETDTTSK